MGPLVVVVVLLIQVVEIVITVGGVFTTVEKVLKSMV